MPMSLKEKLRQNRELLLILTVVGIYVAVAYILSLKCPVVWITGFSCPGCGITRALVSVCKLDFAGAWYYNPMIFYLIPAVPVFLIAQLCKKDKLMQTLLCVTVGLMIAVYLVRLLILHSPVLETDPANGLIGQCLDLLFR